MADLARLATLCKGSVRLDINPQRDCYETVAQHLDAHGDDLEPAERTAMIDANTIIRLHFYPDTPIGFYVVYGVDLDALVAGAIRIIEKDRTHEA